jgi:hypothetical protein
MNQMLFHALKKFLKNMKDTQDVNNINHRNKILSKKISLYSFRLPFASSLFFYIFISLIHAQEIDDRFQRKIFIYLFEYQRSSNSGLEDSEQAKIIFYNKIHLLWKEYQLPGDPAYERIDQFLLGMKNQKNKNNIDDDADQSNIKGFIRVKRNINDRDICIEYLNGIWHKEIPLSECS